MKCRKCIMAAEWAKRRAEFNKIFDGWLKREAQINEMYCDETIIKNEDIPGIISKNDIDLIDAACHIIIANCAISTIIDSQIITIPDHDKILVSIFVQLKRDGINFKTMCEAVEKSDTNKWLASVNEKCVLARSRIKSMWDDAENLLIIMRRLEQC